MTATDLATVFPVCSCDGCATLRALKRTQRTVDELTAEVDRLSGANETLRRVTIAEAREHAELREENEKISASAYAARAIALEEAAVIAEGEVNDGCDACFAGDRIAAKIRELSVSRSNAT